MNAKNFLCLLLLAASCDWLDPALSLGTPRDSGGGYGGRTGGAGAPAETLLLVSAIRFPEGYDWRADSLYDAAPATLVLYWNGEPLFAVPAGRREHLSAAPGLHHLVDGALFSEYADAQGTWIRKNGAACLHYPEAEVLLGLVEQDGAVFTLARSLASEGFTFRRDGRVLLKKDRGRIFGGFGETGYGQNGALYRDGGHLCFAYACLQGDVEETCLVRDGVEELLLRSASVRLLDVKSDGGTVYLAYNEAGETVIGHDGYMDVLSYGPGNHWDAGGLLWLHGRLHLAGWFYDRAADARSLCIADPLRILDLGPDEHFLYATETALRCIPVPGGCYRNTYYFFSRDCACLLGEDLYLALTPLQAPGMPCLLKNDEKVAEFSLNGYLMGVCALVSPPT
ncbi:MAG: hypothetical protein J5871_04065 [Bacteroidales bacterium]|nr:hypothetical protein [Bacteroidales bacterium]